MGLLNLNQGSDYDLMLVLNVNCNRANTFLIWSLDIKIQEIKVR